MAVLTFVLVLLFLQGKYAFQDAVLISEQLLLVLISYIYKVQYH